MPFCHFELRGQRPIPKDYPRELKTLGDHIRKKRLDLGLLQQEVAARIGVDKTTIYNWENSRATPATRHIPQIIEFLDYIPYGRPSSLPQRLVLARRLRGLSRRKLAKVLGVDESTLARWERETRRPSREQRDLIEAFLDS